MSYDFELSETDYMDVTVSDIGDTVSISCWVKAESKPGTTMFFGGFFGSGGTQRRFSLQDNNSNILAQQWGDTGSIGNGVGSGSISTRSWVNVVGSFGGLSSRTCYVDGVSSGGENTTTCAAATIDNITIGRSGDSTPSNPFDGLIAEFACWVGVALSLSDAQFLAAEAILGPFRGRHSAITGRCARISWTSAAD